MALKKDKKAVLDEVFDDERIKSYLAFIPPAGTDADFHVLEKAYRGMKAGDFARFIRFFQAANRDINARNPEGKTMLALVRTHRHGRDYADTLIDAGCID